MGCNPVKRSVNVKIRLPTVFFVVPARRSPSLDELVCSLYALSFLAVWFYVYYSVLRFVLD